MMKFICCAHVSQVLPLTMYTTGLAKKKMHFFWACVSLILFCHTQKGKRYIHSGEIHSLRSTSQRSHRSGPTTESSFLFSQTQLWEMRRLHRCGNTARIKSDSLFEAQFLAPSQLWQIQLWQHSQLLPQCSALPFSRGYYTCSIRPGCTSCISADPAHSLVAHIKQKNIRCLGPNPKIYRWGG